MNARDFAEKASDLLRIMTEAEAEMIARHKDEHNRISDMASGATKFFNVQQDWTLKLVVANALASLACARFPPPLNVDHVDDALVDLRYALHQLREHRDVERALSGVERAVEALTK